MCKETQNKRAGSEAKIYWNNYDSTFSCNAIVKGFISLRKEGTQSRKHFCILLLRLQEKKQ